MEQTIESKVAKVVPIKKWHKTSPIIIQYLVTSIYWVFVKIFMHYKVIGIENLEGLDTKNVIFAANHSSELDPIIVTLAVRKVSRFLPLYYASREKSFYKESGLRQLIYGGLIFRLCGAYPLYTGYHDYETSLVNHIAILKSGKSMCIFPEGKRSRTGTLSEARGGVGYLAYRTQIPVVPIAISGLYNLTFKDYILRKRTLKVTFGKPLYQVDLFDDIQKVEDNIDDHNIFRTASRKIMSKIQEIMK